LDTEAREVLAAAGIEPADLRGEGCLDLGGFVIQPIPGRARGGSSTWQSLARAGSLESDFLNGEIVLLARLAGREAPLNAAVQYQLARAAREGAPPGGLTDSDISSLLDLVDDRSSRDPLVDAEHSI
jgi:thiosulfate/3-mercaptopyruvate sulfurtransferase